MNVNGSNRLVCKTPLKDVIDGQGQVDVTRYKPLARLGYRDYAAVTEVFSMMRPG